MVTGVSYGICQTFVRKLASDGGNLVVVAQFCNRVETLAAELRQRYNTDVLVIVTELTEPEALKRLFVETERAGMQVDLFINEMSSRTQSPEFFAHSLIN